MEDYREVFLEKCLIYVNYSLLLFGYLSITSKKINVVFTTGGYISAPSILAAKLTGTPILLHESNAIPGKVTRLLGRFCDHVALGIPSASSICQGVEQVLLEHL